MSTPEPVALPTLSTGPAGAGTDGFVLEGAGRVRGAARIHLARRPADGVQLQVEVIAPHLAHDAAFRIRFQREAEQLSKLHHVHVQTCLGQCNWRLAGVPALVLLSEHAAGIPLGDLVRRERLPVCDILRLFHQACAGLAAAHRMGIVHGDITPDSLLVTAGGVTKLGGFALGISGYAADRIEHSVTGSPEYMAPEVCRGQQPSSLADLYSLGAVLVTILTGEVPFPARTALECIHLHITAPVPDLAATHPEFAALAPMIGRMLAKDPAQRWASAEELARELLVLSGQVPAEVCCRAPSATRQIALATLVQSALAEAPPAPAEPARDGTTSISRKSVDFFRNPELYKPTGATPALGQPVLPPASPRSTTRTVRRVETAVQQRAPSSLPAVGAMPPAPATARTSATVRTPAPARTAAPAPAPASASASRGMATVAWVVVGVLVLGLVAFAWPRAAPTPPPSAVPVAALPVPVAPAPAVAPASTLQQRIAAIAELGTQDPAAALAQAQALRAELPAQDLAGLPLPLRLVVVGPDAGLVQVTRGGTPVALAPGLVLCRVPGMRQELRIAAEGFRALELALPEGPASGEQVQTVTLLNQARWSQAEFSPTWVRLFPAPGGLVMASDRKVVLIAGADGQERARLDHALFADLPANGLAWTGVQAGTGAVLHLGASGGLCLEAGLVDGFAPLRVRHRGQASVLSAVRLPLALRLGEEGVFALERTPSGVQLAADSQQRRLWARPLAGNQAPWLMAEGDHLLLVGDAQVLRYSQEGEELARLALPGVRSGEPLPLAGLGVVVPTQAGLVAIAAGTVPRLVPGLPAGAVTAVARSGDLLVLAGVRSLAAFRAADGALLPLWAQEDVIVSERRIAHLALGGGQAIVVDDTGIMRAFALGDGQPARIVRPGAPLLTAPLVTDQGWVVVEAPGVLRLY